LWYILTFEFVNIWGTGKPISPRVGKGRIQQREITETVTGEDSTQPHKLFS
jgi:hypothetical protein